MSKQSIIKRFFRPVLGLVLIALLISQLDTKKLFNVLANADYGWFFLACVLLIISNLLSVARWKKIVNHLGLAISYIRLVFLYAQALSANTVLPGGIVGGDVWRSLGLVRYREKVVMPAPTFTHADAAASVLLDRVGGLWSLCLFSFVASLFVLGLATENNLQDITQSLLVSYVVFLGAAVIVPILLGFVALPLLEAAITLATHRVLKAGIETLLKIATNMHLLFSTLIESLLVQATAIATLYLCLKAVGVEMSFALVAAVSLAIFLAAIIPAAISGFGARELAAVVVLGYLGVHAESAFAASVLFGLAGTLQGFIGIYFWIKKEPQEITV
ncbi:MAG: YbhN family protein [Methylophilaceae bacterium]|nr:lysylphosphatidylglycerol synthase transmembrane domain-containing protein [Methyloradius sp.]